MRILVRSWPENGSGAAPGTRHGDGIRCRLRRAVRPCGERMFRAGRLHAHDVLAPRDEIEREQVGIAPCARRPACASPRGGQAPARRRDRVIEQDRIGRLERANRLQRELFGIVGTDADERDPASGTARARAEPAPSDPRRAAARRHRLRIEGHGRQKPPRSAAAPGLARGIPAREQRIRPASAAHRERPCGSAVSTRRRIAWPKIGAAPSVEMPTTTGERLTIVPNWNEEKAGRSTTLYGTPACRAAAAKVFASASSRAAQTAIAAPSRHAGDQGPSSIAMLPPGMAAAQSDRISTEASAA